MVTFLLLADAVRRQPEEKKTGIIRLRPIGRTEADLSGKAYCNVRKDSSSGGRPGNMPIPAINAQRIIKAMPGTTQRPT